MHPQHASHASHTKRTCPFPPLTPSPSANAKDVPQPRVRFSHSDGYLTGMGRSRIDLTLQPVLSGPQTHTVLVQARGGSEVSVQLQLKASQGRYLAYPDMKSDEVPLDLGHCYVDASKRYSKVEPFRIQNVSTVRTLLETHHSPLTYVAPPLPRNSRAVCRRC